MFFEVTKGCCDFYNPIRQRLGIMLIQMSVPLPGRRLGVADDIAKGIVFLASDDASFITGSELVIDGGYTAV